MKHRRHRPAGVLLGTLVAALLVVRPSVPADAHASAVASWPATGQVVTASPDAVTIEFSTDVVPDAVLVGVADASGNPLADGEPVVRGAYVTQKLLPSESAGPWNASFHVIGADMHPIIARVDFTVDPAGVATDNPAGAAPDLSGDDVTAGAAEQPAKDSSGGAGLALLAAGFGGVVLLIVVLRLAARRRTPA